MKKSLAQIYANAAWSIYTELPNKSTEIASAFIEMLAKTNKLQILPHILMKLESKGTKNKKDATVFVQSHTPVANEFSTQIKKILGAPIDSREEHVSSGKKGVVAKFRDVIVDLSVEHQLQNWKKELK